jgi:hypothetical protein
MDLIKILGELYAERQRIIKIIDALESLHGQPPQAVAPKRRGRKFMDAAARRAVSQRMKRYWAARREQEAQQQKPEAPAAKTAK